MASRLNRSEVSACTESIHDLQEMITGSRRGFMNGNTCVLDRQSVMAKLELLEQRLPKAIIEANENIKNFETYQQQIESECRAAVNDANQKAQKILMAAQQSEADAKQKAVSIASSAAAAAEEKQRKAEEEARLTVENARAEAQRIVEEAQRHAAALVAQEEIVRRARVEIKEMQEAAQVQLANIRHNTFDYLDNVMAQADQVLGGMINELRMERNEMNAQR